MTRKIWVVMCVVVAMAALSGCAANKTITYTEWQIERYSEQQPNLQQLVPNPKYQQELLQIQQEELAAAAADAMTEDALTEVEAEIDIPQPALRRVVQADLPATFPAKVPGRKYHTTLGNHPVDPYRPLPPNGERLVLPADAWMEIDNRLGQRFQGWLRAGKRVAAVPTVNPEVYRAIWVEECGNNILNPDHLAIYIRVKVETVPQPSLKKTVRQQRAVPRARARASVRRMSTEPQYILQPVPQAPVTRERLVPVTKTREATCRERKSGWGSVVGGVAGLAGGILSGNKLIAAGAAAGGTLIGGWIDGQCVEAGEVGQAVGFGALGYALTKEQVKEVREDKVREPRDPRDPRVPQEPAPLPPNGPPIDGPAPLPNNGPSYFNGGAPLSPTTSPTVVSPVYGPAPVPTTVVPVYGPATMPATGPGYFPGS